jgi:hypothetical protein
MKVFKKQVVKGVQILSFSITGAPTVPGMDKKIKNTK